MRARIFCKVSPSTLHCIFCDFTGEEGERLNFDISSLVGRNQYMSVEQTYWRPCCNAFHRQTYIVGIKVQNLEMLLHSTCMGPKEQWCRTLTTWMGSLFVYIHITIT